MSEYLLAFGRSYEIDCINLNGTNVVLKPLQPPPSSSTSSISPMPSTDLRTPLQFRGLTSLSIHCATSFTATVLPSTLRYLDLQLEDDGSSANSLPSLATLVVLETLKLSHPSNDRLLASIALPTSLTHMRLYKCIISEDLFVACRGLEALRTLELMAPLVLSRGFFPSDLRSLPKLTSFTFVDPTVNQGSLLECLPETLTSLKYRNEEKFANGHWQIPYRIDLLAKAKPSIVTNVSPK